MVMCFVFILLCDILLHDGNREKKGQTPVFIPMASI